MSRSGLTDDMEDVLAYGRWRAQVNAAIRGKRGQQFLKDLIAALDAMPDKKLIKGDLQDDSGCVCALGAMGKSKGIDVESLDTYDYDSLGATFNIAHQLAQEVMWENDEFRLWDERLGRMEKDETAIAHARWQHIRDWAVALLAKEQPQPGAEK